MTALPPAPALPGDLVAWRRLTGPRPATGFGLVLRVDNAVTVKPLTGSPSHELRRPFGDVVVLVPRARLLDALQAELDHLPTW